MFKNLSFFCLLLFGFSLVAAAQQEDINFTSLATRDGLSSNSVTAILKDRYGLLWFGTEDGLNKFDGTNLKIYRNKTGDSTSLQANEILSLHEDKAGNLWVGTSGGSLHLYDRKKDSFINFPGYGSSYTLGHNVIMSICSDYLGRVWVGHFTGVNILDPITRRATRLNLPAASPGTARATKCVYEDKQKRMWIGTNDGLFHFDPKTKTITAFVHSDKDQGSLANNIVNAITEDSNGNLWIATADGLSLLTGGASGFINYKRENVGLSNNSINSIAVDGTNLWLGTEDGLNIFNIITHSVRIFRHDSRNVNSLSSDAVRTIYRDEQDICWLGTTSGGVSKYDKNLTLFNLIRSNLFDEKGLNARIVTSFAETKSGSVYVGTEGGGLSLFNPKTKLFEHLDIRSQRESSNNRLRILALKMTSKNQLVMGTYGDGLFILNPVSGSYQQMIQGANDDGLNSNNIYCLEEDHLGNIWVGTNGEGINVFNNELKLIARYTPRPKTKRDTRLSINGYIRDLEEDGDGNMWIATHGGGVVIFNPASGKFSNYTMANSTIRNDKVRALLQDSHNNIWVGTFGGGLALFDRKAKNFAVYSEKEGLANNTVHELIEDQKGSIWVSTNKGISSLDLGTKKINNYSYHNGLQNNNFVRGAGLRLGDGTIFFGGLEGINYFNPHFIRKNEKVPPVLLTDLRVSNQSVMPSEDGPIQQHISIAPVINLDYKQNFALSFVGLSYTSPEQNQYAYRLQGFEKDWNYVGSATSASYTNLDPGTYIFRVKASNNDGVWNNDGASIKIIVHPPFWRTIYAYIFYALVLIGALFYIRHKGIQKLKRKYTLQQEKIHAEQERKEAERIRELDRLKIKFLTNLSHEFRTPISLILGPVEKLLTQENNAQSSGQLHLVRRNARRLLNLVNQLLDFRKMEEHELKLQLSEGELVSFVKEVSDSFKDLSERKKIDFIFNSRLEEFHTVFDHDKLERILFNLLSNAFKFTLEGGEISLELEHVNNTADPSNKWVAIKVRDTGIGIPDDKKEKIFERFFQHATAASILNQGTGIGLSITKEFVKMQGGTIEVESELNKGTTFNVMLPFVAIERANENLPNLSVATTIHSDEATEVVEATNGMNKEVDPLINKQELPSILLVEDNDDFRFYLKDNLRSHYKVFEAAHGKEGWQKALSHHPQLVVSDISMPFMDGIELSRKIKADKRTSHIPVILLTALTGEEDQLKGLETGANDYITKPFNF
ncbi:MAG TPA: two-component regulator propeller domain-containing protein, partial [Chitinophagaceae bacterium]|nr:two-component regulator propeller domain-containing protein [Chitinophagaceae bacterium]